MLKRNKNRERNLSIFIFLGTVFFSTIFPASSQYLTSSAFAAGDGSKIHWVSPTGTTTWSDCESATDPGTGKYCGLGTANTNAAAGDTVYLKGGEIYSYTALYATALEPKNSGTAGPPITWITFKNAPGERPEIHGTAGVRMWGISLAGNSYLRIDGMTFTYFTDMALIRNNAHHVEVTNCTFQDGGGFQMVEACTGGSKYTCNVSHIWIHHNNFLRLAAGGTCSAGSVLEGGDSVRVGYPVGTCNRDLNGNPIDCTNGGNHHITIEDNLLGGAGHALLDTYGTQLVIKNNIFHNEPWYPEDNQGCQVSWPASGYTNPDYNGKYGHRNWQMTDDFGRDGTWNLAEGNRSGHASVNPNNDGADNFDLASSKNILRYNYFYNAMNNGLMPKYGPTGWGSVGGLYNRIYNNTIYHNGYGYSYYHTCLLSTCPEPQAGIHYYYPALDMGNVIKNNIVYDNASYGYFGWDIQDSIGNTVLNNWLTSDGDPKFTKSDLSNPSSRTLPDLSLQDSSPAKDAGTYLTQARGAGNNSVTLVVDDALYFQDGSWGSDLARGVTLFPDWIAIGTVSNTVRIAQGGINYSTGTITLASAMTWADGTPIWLFKKSDGTRVLYGSAPDYGAYEYGQGGDTTPPAVPTGLRVQ